jgi:hypothetical protein
MSTSLLQELHNQTQSSTSMVNPTPAEELEAKRLINELRDIKDPSLLKACLKQLEGVV